MTMWRPASPNVAPDSLARHVLAGLLEAAGHQNALAPGQAVGLDDPGPRQRLEIVHGGGGLEGVEGGEARRGHPRRAEHLLHEGLGPLEQGAVGARAHDGPALCPQRVGQAVHERRLGSDHVEVGLDLLDRLLVGTVIGGAMPGLPGVTTTSAVRDSTWASVCSRPPLPTMQTLTRWRKRRSARARARPRRGGRARRSARRGTRRSRGRPPACRPARSPRSRSVRQPGSSS